VGGKTKNRGFFLTTAKKAETIPKQHGVGNTQRGERDEKDQWWHLRGRKECEWGPLWEKNKIHIHGARQYHGERSCGSNRKQNLGKHSEKKPSGGWTRSPAMERTQPWVRR